MFQMEEKNLITSNQENQYKPPQMPKEKNNLETSLQL